jgi:hypothetical protein
LNKHASHQRVPLTLFCKSLTLFCSPQINLQKVTKDTNELAPSAFARASAIRDLGCHVIFQTEVFVPSSARKVVPFARVAKWDVRTRVYFLKGVQAASPAKEWKQ